MPVVRPIQFDDLEELRDLLDGVFRRPRGVFDQSQLTDFPLVFRESNFGNCRVLVEDGRIVSHSALWPRELMARGRRLSVGILVSVATEPENRERGYAAALVRDLMQTMHEDGFDFCVLWTGVPDFYRKLGWEAVTAQGELLTVSPEHLRDVDDELDVVAFDPAAHLEGVLELQSADRLRMSREREEALSLLTLPKVPVRVAIRDDRVEAWLAHGQACNKQGLIDYGGSLAGILDLVRHVFRSDPYLKELNWPAFGGREDLIDWARVNGVPNESLISSKGFGVEMVYVLNRQLWDSDLRNEWFVWGLDWA